MNELAGFLLATVANYLLPVAVVVAVEEALFSFPLFHGLLSAAEEHPLVVTDPVMQ